MPKTRFTGSFTQQEPISEAGIAAAIAVMRTGRLHRYNTLGDEVSETAQLEREFAAYQGTRYCLACASGGYAMHIALRAFGLEPGEPVLTNAFTLSPVPGAIDNAGGRTVLVEITRDLVLDLDDLERKIASSGSRVLLISHMRGHLVDMDALMALLERHGVALIEDCAHTMGAEWRGRKSGAFGVAACFSAQTYKHVNSGEGGLLTTDDAQLMARAVILSGSYMLYERHLAGPPPETYTDIRLDTPNCSGRMDNLRASILRPQIADLDRNVTRWNERYRAVEHELGRADGLYLPVRPAEEKFVGSSIQFLIPGITAEGARAFVSACRERGVELKWFGAAEPVGYTSRHQSWRYLARQNLPRTDAILDELFDMRIPLTFSIDDCRLIGQIIAECHAQVSASARQPATDDR
ncbi:MAG: DegT/DnrJ/EryC1/StrS family aminotransferase [Candidatus Competibacterales bacterium]|nr:DegT/DnrJ/EryC1/StrS family aminotransferase [Candidatus Competibacterales bacterium]